MKLLSKLEWFNPSTVSQHLTQTFLYLSFTLLISFQIALTATNPVHANTSPPASNQHHENPLASRLLAASSYGNIEAINLLIEQGAPINARGIYNETPLMAATLSGQIEAVYVLLNHNPDIHLINHFGATALHVAAENDYPDILELLLDQKANIHQKNTEGQDSLALACRLGNYTTIERLINRKANINTVDKKGNNILMLALLSEEAFAVKMVTKLTGKTFLHRKNFEGISPVTYLQQKKNLALQQAMQQGINLHIADKKKKAE